jgi:hypothetical protein
MPRQCKRQLGQIRVISLFYGEDSKRRVKFEGIYNALRSPITSAAEWIL